MNGAVSILMMVPFFGATPDARSSDPRAAPEIAQLAAELARLKDEVRQQGQILMQVMKDEHEHYQLLLKLLDGRSGGSLPASIERATSPQTGLEGKANLAPRHVGPETATIRGKVTMAGGLARDIYVYLDGISGSPGKGRTVAIVQREKQFVPDVVVVPRGTKLTFPNYDSVYHNVFSPTPPHPFDLGSKRAGDPVRPIQLDSPGVVDVYCNVHARMHASVLIVPNGTFARVETDGRFSLENVPTGKRRIVVWSPHTKPVDKTVDVPSIGADVTLALEPEPEAAHNNKLGQPYGSYKE